SGIATSADSIMVSNSGTVQPEALLQTVQRWSRPALTSYTLFTDSPNSPTHLDIDSNYLYWTEGVAGRVVRRPLAVDFGAGPSFEVLATGMPMAHGIAVDGSTIYVSSFGTPGGSGSVYRLSNSPGSIAAQIATIPGPLEDVAVD